MVDPTVSDVQTRPASEADLPFLERVFLCALRDAITAARGGWDEARERRQFHEQLDLGSTSVIRHCGQDVGFLMVVNRGSTSTLHTLCVLPEWQGRGVGAKVTLDVIGAAAEARRALELYVLKTNPRARAFYERLGFRVVSDSEHHDRMHFG